MGGTISFYDFMNFALNDPINGYYGSGKAELGVRGDFVTSPSLSDDFAFLVGKQIEDWLIQFKNSFLSNQKLAVIEFGYFLMKSSLDIVPFLIALKSTCLFCRF